jgi:hypothetical protein
MMFQIALGDLIVKKIGPPQVERPCLLLVVGYYFLL